MSFIRSMHMHEQTKNKQCNRGFVRATADGGARLAGDPKLNIFTEQLLQIAHLAGDPKRKG